MAEIRNPFHAQHPENPPPHPVKTILTSPLRHAVLKSVLALAATTLLSLPAAHAQTLLSYWNFNNVSPAYNSSSGLIGSFSTTSAAYGETYSQTSASVPGRLSSNSGNGAVFSGSSIYIDFANYGTISSGTINGLSASSGYTYPSSTSTGAAGYGAFADSTVNRVGTDSTTGGSLLLLNTSGGAINKYITFSLSSAGYASLSLTYATRLTNSVTSSQVWSYSLDGVNYFTLTTLSPTANATFLTQTLNLSTLSGSALDNQSSFYLRLTYTSSNTQGSQALDNIQLTGTAVPEPSPALLVLCGLGAAFLCIRRRARVA